MAMSFECFVYACTVLYVLQCPLKCCVYTSTCIAEAVVMSIECEFLWNTNNDIMIKTARPPLNWGNTLPSNKTTPWSGLKVRSLKVWPGALKGAAAGLSGSLR